MASIPAVPAELKVVAQFIQRAQELAQREPVVAYWCTLYGVKLALQTSSTASCEAKAWLFTAMDYLEDEKKRLSDNEAVTSEMVAMAHVENFALKIFINADNEDRAGKASRKTAKTFLAASIFLELLHVFGEIDSETEQKIKYSKWKAADIIKALKEGRVPMVGPPGGEGEESLGPLSSLSPTSPDQSTTTLTDMSMGGAPPTREFTGYDYGSNQPPTFSAAPIPFLSTQSPVVPPLSSPPLFPAQSLPTRAPPAPSQNRQTATSSIPAASSISDLPYSPQVISQAQKHARYVISALEYDDIPTAVLNLQSALALLQQYT